MGFLNIFGGGTPAEKAQKLKAKATQKYGDPTTRQKALEQLAELKHPDAVPVLMQRFQFAVDPQTTDADEKKHVFEAICDLKGEAVPKVQEFLVRNESASSWALRILNEVLPQEQVIEIVVSELKRLGAEYTRDPEKKEVLLHFLEGKMHPEVGAAVTLFLHDMSDDVKMAALKALASLEHPAAKDELLNLVTGEETARRVQVAGINTLVETQFEVQGFREKLEKRLPEGFFIDKAGHVKRRGAEKS